MHLGKEATPAQLGMHNGSVVWCYHNSIGMSVVYGDQRATVKTNVNKTLEHVLQVVTKRNDPFTTFIAKIGGSDGTVVLDTSKTVEELGLDTGDEVHVTVFETGRRMTRSMAMAR